MKYFEYLINYKKHVLIHNESNASHYYKDAGNNFEMCEFLGTKASNSSLETDFKNQTKT